MVVGERRTRKLKKPLASSFQEVSHQSAFTLVQCRSEICRSSCVIPCVTADPQLCAGGKTNWCSIKAASRTPALRAVVVVSHVVHLCQAVRRGWRESEGPHNQAAMNLSTAGEEGPHHTVAPQSGFTTPLPHYAREESSRF